MKKRKYLKYKKYAHFDKKLNIKKAIKILNNNEAMKKHGFFPFIHYTKIYKKIDKTQGKIYSNKKPKSREIYYCAHLDRYIYQECAYKLGLKYNEYAINNDIDDCSTAYRINKGKCNIDFAYEALKYIENSNNCVVIVGDFSNFFDNLDHKALKSRIERIINSKLDNHLFKIFKSITKFQYVELNDLYEYFTKKNGKRSEKYYLKKIDQIMPISEFKSFIKSTNSNGDNIRHFNDKKYEIVQGSPLSGLFANIYMIDFDKSMNEIAKQYNGLYMRYSDDFILVLNDSSSINIEDIYKQIKQIVNNANQIELKKEKTNIYTYKSNVITCINDKILKTNNVRNIISFLGFSFDGENLCIRNKTLTKYYYKMYRGIKRYKQRNDTTLVNLFNKYTKQGSELKKGNFLTYVNRAARVFKKNDEIKRISRDSKKNLIDALNKR